MDLRELLATFGVEAVALALEEVENDSEEKEVPDPTPRSPQIVA